MAEVEDLSTTDASNTARFPENQAPSSVNNGARALEGLLARHFADTNAGMLATATSTTAYTIASNKTVSSYTDGLTIRAQIHATSTGNCTLNVDSVGAQNIVWNDGSQTQLTTGDLVADQVVTFIYDLGNTVWVVESDLTDQTTLGTLSNVVEDTTPQLGGNLDPNGNGIAFTGATVTDVTGADTLLVSGTAGTSGNLGQWNGDGDMVDSSVSATVATQSDQETGTSTTTIVTPGRQHFHPSAVKAFCFVDRSAGTPSLGTNSYNITSVADDGAANTAITIATDFSGTTWAGTSTGHTLDSTTSIHSRAAGAADVEVRTTGGSGMDTTDFSFIACGDHT